MKKFNKNLIFTVIVVLAVSCALGLIGPMTAQAATSPSLGSAATFSILANTGITGIPGIVPISGNVGNNDIGANITALTTIMVGGTIYSSDGFPTAVAAPTVALPGGPAPVGVQASTVDANTALSAGTNADANCIGGVLAPGTDLSALPSPIAPGLYCTNGDFLITGNLTLAGTTGTWIFRTGTGLTTSVGSSVTGGDPCNVWWGVGSLATINGNMIGNILAGTGIHFNTAGTTLNGRALAYGGNVTLTGQTISGPICAAAPVGSTTYQGTINVVKLVINDNGRTKTVADFPLFINDNPIASGDTVTLPAQSNMYTITETTDPNYTRTFSGDCDANGIMYLHPGEHQFCVITNNDIGAPVVVPPVPPLIDVVKVPSPLALPAGPGAVTYTYTLRNIGTVPVTNITMVGDTCSPIVLASGDTNADAKLDLSETWIYNCSTTLSATHTNTVVATGWANGISATDIASATVVVGSPLVPPLIHVTKVPSPLALRAGGGMVTYTEKITNPGTVALSNVKLSDDKCSPMAYISGDTNHDSKLDTTETWTYTCRKNLTATTTNTATASGEANGYTVRDIAIATVVVAAAVPKLPNTGFAPVAPWNIVIPIGIFAISIFFYLLARKKQLI
jgi:uncharacterized repeat protein (TIGR01451 family)